MVQIVASQLSAFAVFSDGKVKSWGYNPSDDRLLLRASGNNNSSITEPTLITVLPPIEKILGISYQGGMRATALTKTGELIGWFPGNTIIWGYSNWYPTLSSSGPHIPTPLVNTSELLYRLPAVIKVSIPKLLHILIEIRSMLP